MADRRIDQLTEAEDISDEDLFVIWKQNISQTRSIAKGTMNLVSKSYVDDKVNDKYSATEVETNKTWIDGRTIYRQCILVNTTSSYSSATEATINSSTTYPDINQIISATLISSSTKRVINPNGVRIVNNRILVYAGAYGTAVGDTLILEYVK